jgi:hypothetical protein
MYPGQDIDLFVLLVQQIFQIFDFGLQTPHSFFKRFGISTREGAAA